MQTRGLAKWIYEQHRRTRAQFRGKKGRAFKAGPLLACGVLAMLIIGAMLGLRIVNVIKHSRTGSADPKLQTEDSRLLEERTTPTRQGWSDSKMLLTGKPIEADSSPRSNFTEFLRPPPVSKEQAGEEKPFQGLWQKRPSLPSVSNPSDAQLLTAGANTTAQHASKPQQARPGLNSQQAQQGLKSQQGSSSGYASQDNQATEYALADRLTAGNKSQSVLPRQQDGLVSKVVSKLLPGALTSRSQDGEVDSAAADRKGVQYGGVENADTDQKLNISTDSEPKATKVPNWTSFLNDNGTTPVVSPVPVASSSSSSSSSANTLGVSSLPGAGSGTAETQHVSSSSSLHAADTLASDARSAQQGTKASPADPTQSQASSMLSQAGLPQSTGDTVPQAGLNPSLGSSDKTAQSSQTSARSSPEGVPDDWEWETYLHLNPDVAAAYGQDPNSARQHWQEWGQREQRRYKAPAGGDQLSSGRARLQQEDEDEAILRHQAELADIDQAMQTVADDMPVLSGSATGSSKTENRFGQRAAQGVKQSSIAADAGGAATQEQRDQVLYDSTTQQPDSSRVEGLEE